MHHCKFSALVLLASAALAQTWTPAVHEKTDMRNGETSARIETGIAPKRGSFLTVTVITDYSKPIATTLSDNKGCAWQQVVWTANGKQIRAVNDGTGRLTALFYCASAPPGLS